MAAKSLRLSAIKIAEKLRVSARRNLIQRIHVTQSHARIRQKSAERCERATSTYTFFLFRQDYHSYRVTVARDIT